jgi:predicted amidohydrolase
MRIGCLQFTPQVGDVENNLNRADAVLNRVDPMDIENLDLLVLPELAFSGMSACFHCLSYLDLTLRAGYNFKSREQIIPFLEPSGSGISSLWARTTALKYDCIVAVGYPERVRKEPRGQDFYNSLIVVNGDGETVANYRKSHLYYTDETWAKEGGGFYQGEIQDLGKVAMGICMDINPYKFQTPWSAFEFGFHVLAVKANLVIISMAWLTPEDARTFTQLPEEPDMETLTYWVQRLEPIIRAECEDEIIFVFANRCGVEGDAVYAGTSAVLGVQNGEVSVYGLLGRGTKELLVVNTEMPPFAKLVNRPGGSRDAGDELSVSDSMSEAAVAPAHGGARSRGQKSSGRTAPSWQQNVDTDSQAHDHGYDEDEHVAYFDIPNYSNARDVAASQGPVSPRQNRASARMASAQNGCDFQDQQSPKEAEIPRRTASRKEGYSPKASPGFRQAASTGDGYSPRFPSPREEYAPKLASTQDRHSPGLTSSKVGYSPGVARGAIPPRIPSPRDTYASREPSPEEWYGAAGVSPTASSSHMETPITNRKRDEEWLRDLASPTFPEPTPLSIRPKLAISTGPETLPLMPKREPPRGMQPGNFFSSRDLCTPPETPFDDEPQPFIQQHWVPPPAFMYTPEEPEWPETVKGTEGIGQLAGRRPSLGNVYAPPRAVPARPASRTQEVRVSDLHDTRHHHRNDQDVPSRYTSKSRNSSRARGPVPDRRPTPALAEHNTPRLRSKRSEPSIRPPVPPASRDTDRAISREDRQTQPPRPSAAPVQSLRDTAVFPWNSITIAASPSVFKTEFQRSETFPRCDPHKDTAQSQSKSTTRRCSDRDGGRLRRSKSISAFHHHDDPTSYLPSPALPVHKAYQDMIYSAVEPAVGIDSMWAAAVTTAAAGVSAPPRRHGSVSSERGARLQPDRLVRPDILSPMSV